MSGWRSRALRAAIAGPTNADQALVAAYRNVFAEGHEDAEMVLADLAAHCGFYAVESRGVSGEDLNHAAGRRAAFARIFHFLSLSGAQLAALEEAARLEAEQMEG